MDYADGGDLEKKLKAQKNSLLPESTVIGKFSTPSQTTDSYIFL